jgi:hypothetical protein
MILHRWWIEGRGVVQARRRPTSRTVLPPTITMMSSVVCISWLRLLSVNSRDRDITNNKRGNSRWHHHQWHLPRPAFSHPRILSRQPLLLYLSLEFPSRREITSNMNKDTNANKTRRVYILQNNKFIK